MIIKSKFKYIVVSQLSGLALGLFASVVGMLVCTFITWEFSSAWSDPAFWRLIFVFDMAVFNFYWGFGTLIGTGFGIIKWEEP